VTELDALQATLAGEHAAVYAYGVVGARLEGRPEQRAARSAYDTHRQRRSTLASMITAAGATPVAAAPAYDVGGTVPTAAAARALAGRVEHGAAQTYADLVGAGRDATRTMGSTWLADAAVREAGWTGAVPTFPGLPATP
jgi:hypothetical protein